MASWDRTKELAAWMGLAVSFAWTAWVSFVFPLGVDLGVSVMCAKQTAAGLVPYVDFSYQYTPALLYLQSGYERLFGGSRLGLHHEIWAHQLVVLALLLRVLRTELRASRQALLVSAALYFPLVTTCHAFLWGLEMEVNLWGWIGIALALSAGRRIRDKEPGEVSAAVLAMGVLSGLAAGLSAWSKQVGGVFVLLAIALPHLSARRVAWKLLFATTAGALVPPAAFFAVHPEALGPFIDNVVLDLLIYAAAEGRYTIPLFVRGSVEHYFWVLPVFLFSALELLLATRRPGAALDPGTALTSGAMLAGGVVLFLPFFARGYPHYLQLPLPFLVYGANMTWALIPRRVSRCLLHVVIPALALLTTVRADLVEVHVARLRPPTPWDRELELAAWVESSSRGSKEILILPDATSIYVLAHRESASGDYQFWPPREEVRRATDRRVPIFFIWRDHDSVAPYPKMLTGFGYRRAASPEAGREIWLPRDAIGR